MSVGDEVEVIILKLNRERNRISLGLKQLTKKPFELFLENNSVGDVVTGTVINLVDFGAFVKLKENVEGLVHISQISHDHIEKASDVLNIGEEVQVKIINIDEENQKISLSIKELLEKPVEEPVEEEKNEEEVVIEEEKEEVVEEKTAEELLQEKVDKLEEELKQSEDKYLRLYAEFENFKRRKNKEIETNNVYKSQKVITEILPSLDNLERALQVESDNEEIKSLLKGVEMVYEGLLNVLKSEGVELIETENAQFDPNYHHAVMQDEDSEKESGVILDTFQKGYKLKDRVIRPAMVKVNS